MVKRINVSKTQSTSSQFPVFLLIEAVLIGLAMFYFVGSVGNQPTEAQEVSSFFQYFLIKPSIYIAVAVALFELINLLENRFKERSMIWLFLVGNILYFGLIAAAWH